MIDTQQALAALQDANPAADRRALPEAGWTASDLLLEVTRRTDMQTSELRQVEPFETPPPKRRGRRPLAALAVGLAVLIPLLIGAFLFLGDSGDDVIAPSTVPTTSVATTVPATTLPARTVPTTVPEAVGPPALEITTVDYEILGVPDVVEPGTQLRLVNGSTEEFHQALIIRLRPSEERTAEELAALDLFDVMDPAGESMKIGFRQALLLARPGEEQLAVAVGSPVVERPGRYLILGLTPVGADPAEAEARALEGPPTAEQLEGTMPHYQAGMFAEFVIEG